MRMNRRSRSARARTPSSRPTGSVVPAGASDVVTGNSQGRSGNECTLQPVAGYKQQLACCMQCGVTLSSDPSRECDAGTGAGAQTGHREIPAPTGVVERKPSPTVSSPDVRTPHGDLRARLPELTLEDEHRLRRRLDQTRRTRAPEARARQQERIAADVAVAKQRIARRRAAVPAVSYPADLPVTQRRDDIAAALRDSQVVVVAGETGSGKTTQLPKIALELGRGVRGRIGHTQPRRIAARSVAERIAEELDSPLGQTVGFKMRFTDQVSDSTLVKLMTDGVLLAEIAHDRLLRQSDTIILDEAHERSLNIDFLLGYLAQLLPKRPDLKLVITSATIDVERVAAHFAGAPVVQVSGRTYPVEVRYRPVVDPDDPEADADRDQVGAVLDAVDELTAEGPGDILVFLAGEREIRDTQDALAERALPNTEIVPLYSRLSAAEQHKVFAPHTGRRIVLATNVAET